MRFNSPPNWPPAPAGWTPWEGWAPDPAWGPAPQGWQFWVDDTAPAVPAAPPAVEPPAVEPPAVEPPPVEAAPPADELPTWALQPEAPASEAPQPEDPQPEAPTFEAPQSEAPAPEPAVAEAPATEAPVFEHPASAIEPQAEEPPAPQFAPIMAPPTEAPPAQPPPFAATAPQPEPQPQPQPAGNEGAPPFMLAPLPTSGTPESTKGHSPLRAVLEVVGALVLLGGGIAIGYVVKGNPKPVQLAAPAPIVKISVSPSPSPVPTTVYVGNTADPTASGSAAPAPAGAVPAKDNGITLDSITLMNDGSGHESAAVRITNNGGHDFDVDFEVRLVGPSGATVATLHDAVTGLAGGASASSTMDSTDAVATQLTGLIFKVDAKVPHQG